MEIRCGNCFQILEYNGICPYCHYDNAKSEGRNNCLEKGFLLAGKYIIGRVLGIGGFGITYLAYDVMLSQIVAIKEYLPNEFSTRVPTQCQVTVYTGDKEEQFLAGQQRFMDEAKKLAQFHAKKGIVQIYDCFDENNTSYIVMEFLQGKTVQELLQEKGTFEIGEALGIIVAVLKALEEVHRGGMLHRDISPDNIFITDQGEAKLIDFGAARYATTSHSKSLSVIIKAGYAPIEQYRSKGNQGAWTDVYGVAATFYKMITGVTPDEAIERSVKDTLLPPSKLGVKINRNLENALMNALNVPVEGRPATAGQFLKQLKAEKVKRKEVKTKKADIGKLPLTFKIAVGGAIAAVVTVAVMVASGRFNVSVQAWGDFSLADGEARVPNVVNLELANAQNEVEENNLVFLIVDKEYSEEIPADKVLMQSVPSGTVVKTGTVVEVTVSGGVQQVSEVVRTLAEDEIELADVQYKSLEDVKSMLEEQGLVVEAESEFSDTVEEGLVISQDTEAGTIVKVGDIVVLHVSKGKEVKKTSSKPSAQSQETQQQQPQEQQPIPQESTPQQQPPQPQDPASPQPQESAPPQESGPDPNGWDSGDVDLQW